MYRLETLFYLGVLLIGGVTSAFAQDPEGEDLVPLTKIDRTTVSGLPALVGFAKPTTLKIPFSHQTLVDGRVLLEKTSVFGKLKDQQVRCLFTLKDSLKLSDQTSLATLERTIKTGDSLQIAAAPVSIESVGQGREAAFATFQVTGDATIDKISCAKIGTKGTVNFTRQDLLRGILGAPEQAVWNSQAPVNAVPQPEPPAAAQGQVQDQAEDAGILEGLE